MRQMPSKFAKILIPIVFVSSEIINAVFHEKATKSFQTSTREVANDDTQQIPILRHDIFDVNTVANTIKRKKRAIVTSMVGAGAAGAAYGRWTLRTKKPYEWQPLPYKTYARQTHKEKNPNDKLANPVASAPTDNKTTQPLKPPEEKATAPEPATPAPKTTAPEPIVPEPKPTVPTPEPIAPDPKPTAPEPVPSAPPPITPAPKPTAPKPAPSAKVTKPKPKKEVPLKVYITVKRPANKPKAIAAKPEDKLEVKVHEKHLSKLPSSSKDVPKTLVKIEHVTDELKVNVSEKRPHGRQKKKQKGVPKMWVKIEHDATEKLHVKVTEKRPNGGRKNQT